MIRTNISDLKNRLSHYLRLVRAGEVVEILDRKTPLARIEAVDGIQGAESGGGWLQRMVEIGIISAPKKKVVHSVFSRLDQVVSEKGKYAGVLEALIEERDESR